MQRLTVTAINILQRIAVNAAQVFFLKHQFLEAHLKRVSVNLLFFSPDWCRLFFFSPPSLL